MNKKLSVVLSAVLLVSSFSISSLSLHNAEASSKHDLVSESKHRVTWGDPEKSLPVLKESTADKAGLIQQPLDDIDPMINRHISEGLTPGAVAFVSRSGQIVKRQAYGHSALYTDSEFTKMKEPLSMKSDTIFDLASISKLFTTTAMMMLYEKGKFKLDDAVAEHLPEFSENNKDSVTIEQLLTHTSGFTSGIPIHLQPGTRDDRIQMVLKHGLLNKPGTTYLYSDLNMITLGALIEKWSGMRQDEFVRVFITNPLGMKDTMYNPPPSLKHRIAATEFQANVNRGLVWGEVHDEKAWSMDGVAGHAGVFSTADDLAVLAHTYMKDGKYGKIQILKPKTIKLIMENYNVDFPGDDHGLGWELNQGWYMDSLTEMKAAGHTGYTGTTLVMSPENETIAILLTNRVHPSRTTPSINPLRRSFARLVGDSIPVEMKKKESAWFAGYGDESSHKLTAKINLKKNAELTFETWYRIEENNDFGSIETSIDGQVWTKQQIWTGKNENWRKLKVQIPADTLYIRFHYETNETINFRGWYIKNVKLKPKHGPELKMKWESNGWKKRNY